MAVLAADWHYIRRSGASPGSSSAGRTEGAPKFQYILSKIAVKSHLFAKLTLIGALPIMHLLRVLHDAVLAQHRDPTNLAVVLPDGQTERRIVEHGTVGAIVKRVVEFQVAPAAV
jgi:hypothetical protein